MNLPANPNALWAWLVVDEAVRQGVAAAVLVPGARSIPLAWAWSQQNHVPVYTAWDERSAGFLALGLAAALRQAVVVVTTSGSAVANLYPAVLEAERSHIPLLLMTADRPPELYYSGANQTIDQLKVFGERVRWFFQLPLPEAQPSARTLRSLRTTVARALAHAHGFAGGPPGPVHLNFPFRKPLEPRPLMEGRTVTEEPNPALQRVLQGRPRQVPWTRWKIFPPELPLREAQELSQLLQKHPRGVIVCGPRLPGPPFARQVVQLAQRLGYPLLADPLSGVRFGPWSAQGPVLAGYALALEAGWRPPHPPQVVLRFGSAPVGNGLLQALAEWEDALHLAVDPYGTWHDPEHHLHLLYRTDPIVWVSALLQALPEAPTEPSPWLQAWLHMEERTRQVLKTAPLGEGSSLATLVRWAPARSQLVVGNSLPIRHLEERAFPSPKLLYTWANRGTSGIEGVLSTGLGFACARPHRPTLIVLGDHSFLYELGALTLVPKLELRPFIVVLHNNGGGIFYRLPIRDFDPPFTPHLRHPHGLDFRPVAEMFRLDYRETTPAALPATLASLSWPWTRPILLVLRTDARTEEQQRQTLLRYLQGDGMI